jgi:hypothetical protein
LRAVPLAPLVLPEPSPASLHVYRSAVAAGRLERTIQYDACREWQARVGLTVALPSARLRGVPRELPATYALEDSLWIGAREKATHFGRQLDSVHMPLSS